MSTNRHHNALPSGYKLHWYVIGSVIGQGGFGITYMAVDTNLDQRVAIKEFLPVELVTRSRNSHVHPLSGEHTDTYGWGLNRFVTEARTLAKFRHPNIVRVMSVFEANNTAYMVMEYEQGESLESALRSSGIASEDMLREIMMPLLDGLAIVHAEGFIHRDIKPDNIYLRADRSPVLLDFGSARQALGVATRTLTALVSPGYAPFEQYDTTRAGEKKQGPWTDIYALGATLYRGIAGRGPADAMARVNAVMGGNDILKPAAQAARGNFSPAFLAAIDWALAFLPEHRPQNIGEWRAALNGEITPPKPKTTHSLTTEINPHAPTEVMDPASLGGSSEPGDEAPVPTSGTMVASGRIAPPPPKPAPGAAVGSGAGRTGRIAGIVGLVAVVIALGAWYVLTPPPALVQHPASTAGTVDQDEAARRVADEAALRKQREEQKAREVARRDEATELQAALDRERAATEAARREVEIEKLLRKAATALAADRLTTPADDNAFSHYNSVLAMDPGNDDAVRGLKSVLDRYLVLAKAAWRDKDFDLAARHLDKAAGVSPGAESVAAARATLEEQIEADRQEKSRAQAEARRMEDERRRMEAARLAAEEERKRMEAARLAAEEERRRIERERLAELERKRLAEEAEVLARMEKEFQTAQKIAGLLAAAEDDLAAGRFTGPPESNAVDRYRAVLELDGSNSDARAGLKAMADRQVERARKEIDAYEFKRAAASLALAEQIDGDTDTLAPAQKKLAVAVAAYNGSAPLANPPFRFTFMPVAGNYTCIGVDPKPDIERVGPEFLKGDRDVDYVPVTSKESEVWIPSGVSKEPHRRRLFPLGRELKLDGALMYWFSAVGVQCVTIHVDVYLVDLQMKEIYHTRGRSSDLKEMSGELLDQFRKERVNQARGR